MKFWSKEEESWLKENHDKLGTATCATVLERTRKSVKDKARRLRGDSDSVLTTVDFESAVKSLNDYVNYHWEKANLVSSPEMNLGDPYTVAVMPCLHIPYHSEKNLAKFLADTENTQIDELVIAG